VAAASKETARQPSAAGTVLWCVEGGGWFTGRRVCHQTQRHGRARSVRPQGFGPAGMAPASRLVAPRPRCRGAAGQERGRHESGHGGELGEETQCNSSHRRDCWADLQAAATLESGRAFTRARCAAIGSEEAVWPPSHSAAVQRRGDRDSAPDRRGCQGTDAPARAMATLGWRRSHAGGPRAKV